MARKKMITRTCTNTTATVMCLNIETKEVTNVDFSIAGKFDNDNVLLDKLRSIHEVAPVKMVTVITSECKQELYGMDEQTFMAHAKLLPPRKVYGDTADGEDVDYLDDEDEDGEEA